VNSGVAVYTFADSSYRIVRESGEAPVWVRDGRTVLFVENGRLSVLDLPTGDVTLLSEISAIPDVGDGGYCLSPDKRTIYFIRGESESDIWEARLR
jgi:hypothetical protein